MGIAVLVIVSFALAAVISEKASGSKMFSEEWLGHPQMTQWHDDQEKWNKEHPDDQHPNP